MIYYTIKIGRLHLRYLELEHKLFDSNIDVISDVQISVFISNS